MDNARFEIGIVRGSCNRGFRMRKSVDASFFDLELYCIYKAATELFGNDEAWRLVWRSGEVMFEEIRRDQNLQITDPIDVMKKVAAYLEEVGYSEKLTIQETGKDLIEYTMLRPAIGPGAQRLIKEGAVPGHISTSVLFAALKKGFDMKAEMIGEPVFRPDGTAVEKWRLSRTK